MDNDDPRLAPATFVRLTPEMARLLKEKASAEDRTMSGLIRQALRAYLGLDIIDSERSA